MQEVIDELNGRVDTLERSIEYDRKVRTEHLEAVVELNERIEQKARLADQYGRVLADLPGRK